MRLLGFLLALIFALSVWAGSEVCQSFEKDLATLQAKKPLDVKATLSLIDRITRAEATREQREKFYALENPTREDIRVHLMGLSSCPGLLTKAWKAIFAASSKNEDRKRETREGLKSWIKDETQPDDMVVHAIIRAALIEDAVKNGVFGKDPKALAEIKKIRREGKAAVKPVHQELDAYMKSIEALGLDDAVKGEKLDPKKMQKIFAMERAVAQDIHAKIRAWFAAR